MKSIPPLVYARIESLVHEAAPVASKMNRVIDAADRYAGFQPAGFPRERVPARCRRSGRLEAGAPRSGAPRAAYAASSLRVSLVMRPSRISTRRDARFARAGEVGILARSNARAAAEEAEASRSLASEIAATSRSAPLRKSAKELLARTPTREQLLDTKPKR